MSQVNISYKTAKALKEFLGESAPEPMVSKYWRVHAGGVCPILVEDATDDSEWLINYPAYQLHDLLSKPFGEAMFPKLGWLEARDVTTELFWAWEDGCLPAVERALEEMMK